MQLPVLSPKRPCKWNTWMKSEGEYSQDMLQWFEVEGLTYAMETKEEHQRLVLAAGFESITISDRSPWFRKKVKQELEQLRTLHYPRVVDLIGTWP